MVDKIPHDGVRLYEIRNEPMEKALDQIWNFVKKHGAVLTFVATLMTASWWFHHSLAHLEVKIVEGLSATNSAFSDKLGALEARLNDKIDGVRSDLHAVEKDVAIIKTILIMKGYMPPEMAAARDAM